MRLTTTRYNGKLWKYEFCATFREQMSSELKKEVSAWMKETGVDDWSMIEDCYYMSNEQYFTLFVLKWS